MIKKLFSYITQIILIIIVLFSIGSICYFFRFAYEWTLAASISIALIAVLILVLLCVLIGLGLFKLKNSSYKRDYGAGEVGFGVLNASFGVLALIEPDLIKPVLAYLVFYSSLFVIVRGLETIEKAYSEEVTDWRKFDDKKKLEKLPKKPTFLHIPLRKEDADVLKKREEVKQQKEEQEKNFKKTKDEITNSEITWMKERHQELKEQREWQREEHLELKQQREWQQERHQELGQQREWQHRQHQEMKKKNEEENGEE
ncbi:hypothetical protein [Priestia megaterium]|uniref:hypothetical protein n=1 Tax=Priestia megaterium TaxID=1404 RepID=UPI0018CD896D|nr:hypothetical protein [Priestia megaterium]MBG9471999.1 hypothetical protein [Priestia megaterium]